MREAFAITGFVSNGVAKQLQSRKGGSGTIEVKLERGNSPVLVKVDSAAVQEVRTGASSKGETGIQLILHENASVETVLSTSLNKDGIARLTDPLVYWKIRPPVFKIMV